MEEGLCLFSCFLLGSKNFAPDSCVLAICVDRFYLNLWESANIGLLVQLVI